MAPKEIPFTLTLPLVVELFHTLTMILDSLVRVRDGSLPNVLFPGSESSGKGRHALSYYEAGYLTSVPFLLDGHP